MTRLLSLIFLVTSNFVQAADWPAWRGDAGRGNYTAAELPGEMHLAWTRRLPSTAPAWPATQLKLQFDRYYNPIVIGRRMILSSSATDGVLAFDTRSGDELWRFTTNGPVRFAPVAGIVDGEPRVFFASDDGHLYCLDVEQGNLRWKVNGGPERRLMLGNERLISSWPARGGPMLVDDTVYFAAGIWPFMGIFIHAVDAKTGDVRWTNSEMGAKYVVHPHGAPSFGSVVPQGHLAVTGDHLIVPGGRSVPAIFNRQTGKLAHFEFDKRVGHHDVMAGGGQYFVAGSRYQVDGKGLGLAQPSAITPTATIALKSGRIEAHVLEGTNVTRKKKDRKGKEVTTTTYETAHLWTIDPQGFSPAKVHLVAGNRVYASDGARLAAFDLPKSGQHKLRPAWTATVGKAGKVVSLLAADDRLFAVTDQHNICCFGSEKVSEAKQLPAPRFLAAGASQPHRVLAETGVQNGYVVGYGFQSIEELASLAVPKNVHVIGVHPRPDEISTQRHGERLQLMQADPLDVNLPPYLANLIVVTNFPDEWKTAGPRKMDQFFKASFRSLRPYGGTLALPLMPEADRARFAEGMKELRLQNFKIKHTEHYTCLVREGPLPGAGSWNTQYADASNSGISLDTRVKAPLGVLWFGGPSNEKVLPRHGHGPSPQVAGGRIIVEGPDMLRALDVYTGRLLWERDLPGLGEYYNVTSHFPGAGEVGTNYVSLPDHIYVVYGSKLLELDAATGETGKTYRLPSENGTPASWGFATVSGDYLAVTTSPVQVEGVVGKSTSAEKLLSVFKGFLPVVPPNAKWKYLAGTDPDGLAWTKTGFDDKTWKTAVAGFGYGDKDDKTELKMKGKYSRVYIRKTFDGSIIQTAKSATLMVNYDDAFIAYLNGTEIARIGVVGLQGKDAKEVKSHEAKGFESFPIKDFSKLLKPGENVLAIEGHNDEKGSSDFTLDPFLMVRGAAATRDVQPTKITELLKPAKYASASRQLVVFNRHTGEQLWHRQAEWNFRHNGIAIGSGKLFCIDGMSTAKQDALKRRGIDPTGKAKLYALDLKTGDVVWSDAKNVFGTFLSYSAEHDVLLQAGSAYRDRARDEIGRGMVAYRGGDGHILWHEEDLSYGGPCLLWKDKIITNGGGGFQLELLTGKRTGWEYGRMYGCNTAIGCQNMLTFRSGAAGFCDLLSDSGTGNIGGFRSSCTSNLIPADGVLAAPDYTRTCTCAYQLQTSLALVHMPQADYWTFNVNTPDKATRLGINLGAPGDRRDEEGTLWIEAPTVGGPSPKLDLKIAPKNVEWFQRHASEMESDGDHAWVAASGGTGIASVTVKLPESIKKTYMVTLYFSEPASMKVGERVFNIHLQDKLVAKEFDVAREAKGLHREVGKTYRGIAGRTLTIRLEPVKGQPVLSGVEVHSAAGGALSREAYLTFAKIAEDFRKLRAKSAGDREWEKFTASTGEKLDPLMRKLSDAASVKTPIQQQLLWAGRDYFPFMLKNERNKAGRSERSFVRNMERAREMIGDETLPSVKFESTKE